MNLIDYAMRWVGYEEKSNEKVLGESLDRPEKFEGNGVYNNYTIFAKVYEKLLNTSAQGQPWCATFVNMMYIAVYGKERAKKMLGGSFSLWTPTFAKNVQCSTKNPLKVGIPIFFKNSERIHHVGIIQGVNDEYIYTIEGNTKVSNDVVAEGHIVTTKKYKRNNKNIAGWGVLMMDGWNQYNAENWEYWNDNAPVTNCIASIDGLVYGFNRDGDMLKGVHVINGKRYYFDKQNGWQIRTTDGLPKFQRLEG